MSIQKLEYTKDAAVVAAAREVPDGPAGQAAAAEEGGCAARATFSAHVSVCMHPTSRTYTHSHPTPPAPNTTPNTPSTADADVNWSSSLL